MARKKLLTEGEVRQFMKLANLGPLSENYFSNNPLEEEELEDELEATEDELGAEDHFADEEADELDALGDEGGDADNEALLARVVQAVAAELGVEVDVEGADAEGGEELEVDAELEEPLPGGDELEMGAEEELELPGGRDMYQETQGADDREDEHLGAEDGAESGKKQSEKDRRKEMRGARRAAGESGDPVATQEGQEVDEAMASGGSGGAFKSQRAQSTRQRHGGGLGRDKCYDADGNRVECDGSQGEVAKRQAAEAVEIDQDAIVAEVARRVAERLSAAKKNEEMADQLAERIFQRLTAK